MNKHSDSLGVLMLDLEGTELTEIEQDLLQRTSVGGLILFSRNYKTPSQLKQLIIAARECREDILIAVDQEGGRVQRFREGFLQLPTLNQIGKVFLEDKNDGLEKAGQCAWAMAAEVLHYGIDISFAPVLDLYNSTSRVIAERAFSAEASEVIELATAYIDGMNLAGMKASGKHFPGHGSVEADSHHELPIDDRSAQEILDNDYRVFAELASKLDGLMPAHVKYPAIDEQCAGYSRIWIQEKIRRELQFGGVVFSDDLSMAAAHTGGEVVDRAALAIEAGCDMILVCNDREAAIKVADWIEQENIPVNERISTMRAAPAGEIENLYAEPKWEAAKKVVESLIAF